ncbi:hypothetical protein AR158_C763R [Paramecium bursaria Chlorella virus AR158]|uniref:hypothetical protein n=1 Tax=Paramecium bursaria Chlorella virus AR158 TaxID=380598 RepID=UPI00015AA8C8|nr:hypothetical protein AR158_C763R [Paramecium bursaria Chlorella virus AR158]ABU44308.1 hypothetical protein AR158_C763R [Paramecium bursaria Chlorella virus AR158]
MYIMGNTTSKGTGGSVYVPAIRSGKCSKVPQYADRRAWALKELYGIKNLNEFPPQVYSLQDANDDINDCVRGYRLRHSYKVVSTQKLEQRLGKDPRIYALRKYHGYTDVPPRVLALLPYSKQNAVRDISYYKKYRTPYFTIDRLTSTVRSKDGKITRTPGQKGTQLDYKYNRTKINQKGKFSAGKKYDPRKYPLQSMKDGSVGRVIPCSVDPSQCTPGQTTFISRDVSDVLKRAAIVNAKSKKQSIRALQTTHAKKIAQLNKKIASAPPEVKARLQKQRQNMQLKFRLDTAKAEQVPRVQIASGKTNEWKQKRAELGRQKQQAKQIEQARKKREEAERRAAAERKAKENAAIRAQRAMKKQSMKQQSAKKQKSIQKQQQSMKQQSAKKQKSIQKQQQKFMGNSARTKSRMPSLPQSSRSMSVSSKFQRPMTAPSKFQRPMTAPQMKRPMSRQSSESLRVPYSRIRSSRNPGSFGAFG